MKPVSSRFPNIQQECFNTIFGWVVFGGTTHSAVTLRADVKPSLETLLSKLWEREEVPEIRTSIHYQDHYQMADTQSLFQEREHCPLWEPHTQEVVIQECSLHRRGKLESFQEALQEYSTLGHAEEVPSEDLEKMCEQHYYLPVHVVFKATSSTTKTKPVFDASAKTTTGRLLNDTLLPTCSLLPQIFSLITSFRVALTADVGKMFREIALKPQEKYFHRFLEDNLMAASRIVV